MGWRVRSTLGEEVISDHQVTEKGPLQGTGGQSTAEQGTKVRTSRVPMGLSKRRCHWGGECGKGGVVRLGAEGQWPEGDPRRGLQEVQSAGASPRPPLPGVSDQVFPWGVPVLGKDPE